MRRAEYPRWMRIVGDTKALVVCAVLIVIGVRYLTEGNQGGRIIGVVLLGTFGVWALWIVYRTFANR